MTFFEPKSLSEGFTDFSKISKVAPAGPETKEQIIKRYTQVRDMSNITVIPAEPEINPFDKKVRKRVAVYCRVSTDNLSQTPSFLTQQRYYLEYVRQHSDLQLIAMYKDEGVSATRIKKREGLIRLINDAEAGKFDMVIVKDLSRLSRNLMDCMQIIYKFRHFPKPVGIFFESENIYTLDTSKDFTLQILALVAQEESRKKSIAVTAAQRQRYTEGIFIIPDLLGYDKIGVNEIAVNPEEADTVQLIFTMYLAGCNFETIAGVLNMLGRKKHSHIYKDGRVKKGEVNWNKQSVMNVLLNEKRCGHVDAQKTITLNFLNHNAVKNVNKKAPRYYETDHHQAIVRPYFYFLAQRMLAANRGGWKYGLQKMKIYETGFLAGGVSTIPNWYGFTAEDYNRACLRASGKTEEELEGIEKSIVEKINEAKEKITNPVSEPAFPSMIEIDSDDYEKYPKQEIKEKTEQQENDPMESFGKHIKILREERKVDTNKEFPDIETCRAEFFSLTEKVCVTFDHLGTAFNKFSFTRLNEGEAETITNVELVYNPLEQIVILRKAKKAAPSTITWAKEKNGKYEMKRCCTKGLSGSIYKNMNWNTSYKYRIVGRAFEHQGETMLIFFLDSCTKIVPAKVCDEEKKTPEKKTKRKFKDGDLTKEISLPAPEDIEFEYANLTPGIKSGVFYLDEQAGKDEDIKDTDRFSAERITRMIEKGLTPEEGWDRWKCVVVKNKNGFTIYPESWADSFGDNVFRRRDLRLQAFLKRAGPIEEGKPYGWTVGVDLPTMKMVKEKIEELKTGT